MYYSFKVYCLLLFIIKITSTLDGSNQLKKDNYSNNYELQKPCIQSVVRKFNKTTNFSKIPLNIIKELYEVANASELYMEHLPRFLQYNNTQGLSIVPKFASCAIETHTISLRKGDDNPNLYYSPYCTRIKQCGGCCGSDLVSCQPSVVEMINFEVVILEYNNNTFTFKENKNVTIEQHVKCKCDCTEKENDCIPLQEYNGKECRCICKNLDNEDKCDENLKIWNSRNCMCECYQVEECTTGLEFNHNTCSCERETKDIFAHIRP